jgi:hypothetical protein
MFEKFDYEREKEINDKESHDRTGIESYEQKLDRWRANWRREIDDDLDKGY